MTSESGWIERQRQSYIIIHYLKEVLSPSFCFIRTQFRDTARSGFTRGQIRIQHACDLGHICA